MRLSQYPFSTLREDPAEAEIASHKLLYKAGYIRKAAGGIYIYSPFALRVLRKIAAIIREEMDKRGGLELQLPILQPSEPWKESGRWGQYGSEMFVLEDRNGREFCLGPTHEDIITWLVRGEVRSYKQLPVRLYQIANKYRDEIRPRFGLMRSREFIMKDLYSFDADITGMDKSYSAMYEAYCRIFTRCGLSFRAVEADSGLIGGDVSHEFMVLAESGEAEVVYCDTCGYAANTEKAECARSVGTSAASGDAGAPARGELTFSRVHTPGAKTVGEICAFLGCPPGAVIKTLLFTSETKRYAALVVGTHTVNPVKLAKAVGEAELTLADGGAILEATGALAGFAGPIGLAADVAVVSDFAVTCLAEAIVGANAVDAHFVGVKPGIDFDLGIIADIREAMEGDRCPRCPDGVLHKARGIEVGHIFKLGSKYSESMNAVYIDREGKEQPLQMGCFGIGVSRTLAAAVEQCHDANGIAWPATIAPYDAIVVPVSLRDPQGVSCAESLYEALQAAGIDVVIDDRDERPGVKFKDADLMGFPVRITVGAKALATGDVEVCRRSDGEIGLVPRGEVIEYVRRLSQEVPDAHH